MFTEYGLRRPSDQWMGKVLTEKFSEKYFRSCSAALLRSKSSAKVAQTKAQQASIPSSGEVFCVNIREGALNVRAESTQLMCGVFLLTEIHDSVTIILVTFRLTSPNP